MRTTIDRAGRLVIPKVLRDRVGITDGEIEITVDGAGLRIESVTDTTLVAEGDLLVVPKSGTPIDDDVVRLLRDADRR